jgi:hypothetical protein
MKARMTTISEHEFMPCDAEVLFTWVDENGNSGWNSAYGKAGQSIKEVLDGRMKRMYSNWDGSYEMMRNLSVSIDVSGKSVNTLLSLTR